MTKKNWRDLEKRVKRLQTGLIKNYIRPISYTPFTAATKELEDIFLPLDKIGTHHTEYKHGYNYYRVNHEIIGSKGIKLGEIGIEFALTTGPSYTVYVSAFLIWLHEEGKKYPKTTVAVSKFTCSDESNLTFLTKTKGDCYPATENGIITLNTDHLYTEVLISSVEYGNFSDKINNYFERISFDLTVWKKQT